VEPLITKAKNDTTHSRRMVFSYLQNKDAVSELFRDVAVKVGDRPGGYTQILRTGNRLGDNAEMCIIELVDYNEAMLASLEEAAKPKRRRSRRGSSGSGKKTETPKSEATEGKKTEKMAGPTTPEEDTPEMEETGNDSPAKEKKTSAESSGNVDAQASEDVNSEAERSAEQDKDVDEKKEE
jgi:large subunit ribosomal protein L17